LGHQGTFNQGAHRYCLRLQKITLFIVESLFFRRVKLGMVGWVCGTITIPQAENIHKGTNMSNLDQSLEFDY